MVKKGITVTLLVFFLLLGIYWANKNFESKIDNAMESRSNLIEYIDSNPEDIDAKRKLGLRHLAQKEYSEAEAIFEELYIEDNSNVEILHPLIITKLHLEKYKKGIELSYELLKFNNYNSVALFNLAQLYFLMGDDLKFVENLDLSIKAYNFMKQDSDEFDNFYHNIESLKNHYAQLVNSKNKEGAYSLIVDSELFHYRVIIKAIENIDIHMENNIDPDLLATKSLLEFANGHTSEAYETIYNMFNKHSNYLYAFYLYTDMAYRENDLSKLKKIRTEYPLNANLIKFYETILPKNKEYNIEDFKSLENIYAKETGRVKQLISYYLVQISREIGDKENEKLYNEIFLRGNFDEYYTLMNL